MPLQLDNDAEFREAQAALFNVNSQAGWLLFSYVGPQTVHFGAGGEGGPEEIVDNLHDDQIQYPSLSRIIIFVIIIFNTTNVWLDQTWWN